jgi:fatty acyl-CoA reductase
MAVIPEALAGKRIAVTGATGFLGTALVERLLRSVPDCQVFAVVRPGRRGGASERVRRDVLRNDCFDRLRQEWGRDFDTRVSERLVALAGDVSVDGVGLDDASREALAEAEVVIHSAATVSFDAPLDSAVEVNLLGPRRVAEAMATSSPGHLVAVSTAYVAGNRRGTAPESSAGPGPRLGLARRLRLHQGPRRAGPGRRVRTPSPSPSSARRSSSRPWPSRAPGGSAASAWPSRSSSPTPGGC